jgi:putative transposase
VLAHRTAITLESVHAVQALAEAFARFGKPEIVNTDRCHSSLPGQTPEQV